MAREWTVMVYLAADNNLSVDFLWNLKEMEEVAVGPNEQVNKVAVVAQYDPGQGIPTQRYVINDGTAAEVDDKDGWLLLDGRNFPDGDQNKNSADSKTLCDFIRWGIEKYKAPHYMVVLAGHGSGAVEDFLLKDATSRDSLTLDELKRVFQEVQQDLRNSDHDGKLEILGMDCCLMSMAEVGYQVKESVTCLVGAEGFEPCGGWPYQKILKSFISLSEKGEKNPRNFAKKIVEDYALYYFDFALAGLSVDLAACDIEKASLLKEPLQDLVSELTRKLDDRTIRSTIISARQEAQSYKFGEYVDLWHFCNLLGRDFKDIDNDLVAACDKVKKAIHDPDNPDGDIVLDSSYVGPDCQDSHGLSVYFPRGAVSKDFSERYQKLAFAETNWHDFLQKFTEKMGALQAATSEETKVDEVTIRFAGKTRGSGTGQYSGDTFVGYGKAPSLVWRPPEGLREHVLELGKRLTGAREVSHTTSGETDQHPPGVLPGQLEKRDVTEYLGVTVVEDKPDETQSKAAMQGN